MPMSAAHGNWYKANFATNFGEPVHKFTIEDLIEFDKNNPKISLEERFEKNKVGIKIQKQGIKL